MHNVVNAKVYKNILVKDVLEMKENKLSDKLGYDRYKLFCTSFLHEVYEPLGKDIANVKIDVTVKEIHNDKYAKYTRLNQIETTIYVVEGIHTTELKCQWETSVVENPGELPFEECSLMSKYAKIFNHETEKQIHANVH